MKVDRLLSAYCWQGTSLTVREMAEDGYAELVLQLPKDGLLLQYKPNLQFVFKNRKRADGIVFFPVNDKAWGVLLVELKRAVNSGNKWQDIKLQWHGAWLHSVAIAAVLGITLAGRVEVMVAYRNHHMAEQLPDPILLKLNIADATLAQVEWASGRVNLPELGPTTLHRQQLDEVTGIGHHVFA
jgi:hypothetical protein